MQNTRSLVAILVDPMFTSLLLLVLKNKDTAKSFWCLNGHWWQKARIKLRHLKKTYFDHGILLRQLFPSGQDHDCPQSTSCLCSVFCAFQVIWFSTPYAPWECIDSICFLRNSAHSSYWGDFSTAQVSPAFPRVPWPPIPRHNKPCTCGKTFLLKWLHHAEQQLLWCDVQSISWNKRTLS